MEITFEQCWRWFGPNDPITLAQIKQTGATGIVTSLHDVENGEIWTIEQIQQRKEEIERAGLSWSVVESVPVHEEIKRRTGKYQTYIEHYKSTLRNLSACGIDTVCYNFMPVLDWTRTNLGYSLADGAVALRFEMVALAAFDMFILKRANAQKDYSEVIQEQAKKRMHALSKEEKEALTETILAGLPGSVEDYGLSDFSEALDAYSAISASALTRNLHDFLKEIIPVAEEVNIRMCIHPDDPPFPLFGLPRVVSTPSDIDALFTAVPSPTNGLTFCTGSFGVRPDNDLPAMIDRFGSRIHFVHLRSTLRDAHGNFFEAPHLHGDVDMPAVMNALIKEQHRRITSGRTDLRMPYRPDHGHILLDEQLKNTYPGYSMIGRLKGLAELRGLELGIRSTR